ncbi:Golgi-associated plant pathogenesis-related protein 1-like isoform X2 [Physella acuta]|uniref:Golgi-associated plant pathogenesis-related protein 1-like isoform X2 n=1 Tax=Physella acuta TaxID=109671 RepID=UPI0027DBC7F4|nr:Golgi-associated plant pathogenesis-related protein 1-like isoform X2 [Physella acuta]
MLLVKILMASLPVVAADESDITRFRSEALAAHNECRAKHHAPPLTLSADLNDYAQNWANHLAKTGKLAHSDCKMNGEVLGENVAYKWASGGPGADMTGKDATQMWYAEIKDYKSYADASSASSNTGHFTQVVWKSTKQLGMGKAKTSDGKVFVVGSYRPPGNYVGMYKENVLPPK